MQYVHDKSLSVQYICVSNLATILCGNCMCLAVLGGECEIKIITSLTVRVPGIVNLVIAD